MVGQIDSLKLGISLGILWGLSVFFVTFIRFKKNYPYCLKVFNSFILIVTQIQQPVK